MSGLGRELLRELVFCERERTGRLDQSVVVGSERRAIRSILRSGLGKVEPKSEEVGPEPTCEECSGGCTPENCPKEEEPPPSRFSQLWGVFFGD